MVTLLRSLSLVCIILPSATYYVASFGIVPTVLVPAASRAGASFGRQSQQQQHRITSTAMSPTMLMKHQPLHYSNDASISLEDIRLDDFDVGEEIEDSEGDGANSPACGDSPLSQPKQKKLGIKLSDYMETVPPISSDVITKLHDETRANINKIVDRGVKELNDLSEKLHRDISQPYEHSRVQWDRGYYKKEMALRQSLDNKIGGFLADTSKYRQETHDQALIDNFMKDTHLRKAIASSRGIKYEVNTPTKEQAQAALVRAKQLVKQLQQKQKSSSSSSSTIVDDIRWEDDDISDDDNNDW